MSDFLSPPHPNQGQIKQGIQPNTLIRQTLDFVRRELPVWRDDPNRAKELSEEKLNAQLCKYLNVEARHKKMPFLFHHEEKQTRDRRVDISAGPDEEKIIDTTPYSIYDPFLVFEGKRLPAPTRIREREYLRLTVKENGKEKYKGGIQRFKLGLHGKEHKTAALIGYVQKDNCSNLHTLINSWICELANETLEDEVWDKKEQLSALEEDTTSKTAFAKSSHSRIKNCVSNSIELHHFWVDMSKADKNQ